MQLDSDQFTKTWAKILAKSWSDPSFRESVQHSTTQVLRDYGVDIPTGMTFSVGPIGTTNASSVMVLPFPEQPQHLDMLEDSPPPPPCCHHNGGGGGSSSSSLVCCCCCP